MRSRPGARPETARLIALFPLALGLAGCSSGESAERQADVRVAGFRYSPVAVEIQAGGRVTFENLDKAPHTASSDEGSPWEFDTKRLETSEGDTIEFDKPGSYPYFCRFHPFMTGTVEVVE
jgi:plastocyanin